MLESRDTSYQGGGSEDGGWGMRRAPKITLKVLLVSALALGTFLGCGSGVGKTGVAPGTTWRPAVEVSNAEPQDVAGTAAAASMSLRSARTWPA